jgi:hypothetical protein
MTVHTINKSQRRLVEPQLYSLNSLRKSHFGIPDLASHSCRHYCKHTMENDQVRNNMMVVTAETCLLMCSFQGLLVDLYVPRKCAATSE